MNDRKNDLDYLKPIIGIRIEEVGPRINEGVHHRVYEYGISHVIKVPRRRFNFLYTKRSHIEADLVLIEKHFPRLVVSTSVFSTKDHSRHCIVQEKLSSYVKVTPKTIPLIQDQLCTLLRKNMEIEDNFYFSLDVLGGEGFSSSLKSLFDNSHTPYFSNLVIVKEKNNHTLKLLDSELLRLKMAKLSWFELVSLSLSHISLQLTRLSLKHVFKLHL